MHRLSNKNTTLSSKGQTIDRKQQPGTNLSSLKQQKLKKYVNTLRKPHDKKKHILHCSHNIISIISKLS